MATYLNEFKGICDQMSSIGLSVPENMKIFGVLNGLGKEYEAITAVIESSLNTFPNQSYDSVVAQITGFDDRLQSYDSPSDVTPHLAFTIGRGYAAF